MNAAPVQLDSVDAVIAALATQNYLCDRRLATALFLSLKLQRPLFLEGEPGVGKTELAKALAALLGTPLLRLQCYEGLDIAQTAYEWNVARQMVEIRLAEASQHGTQRAGPRHPGAQSVLAPDADRAAAAAGADAEPLAGAADRRARPRRRTLRRLPARGAGRKPDHHPRAGHRARQRAAHHADHQQPHARGARRAEAALPVPLGGLSRRGAGNADRAAEGARCFGATAGRQVVEFVQRMRTLDLFKSPGVAETIDWANALVALNTIRLDPASVHDTLGVLLKYQDDITRVQGAEVAKLLDELRARALLDTP
jgi:MoxR-like ATPase